MNPAIVYRRREPSIAWLVDASKIFRFPDAPPLAVRAIYLGDLRGGELMKSPDGRFLPPTPGRLYAEGDDWVLPHHSKGDTPKHFRPMHRGIMNDAAEVLLVLAGKCCPFAIKNEKLTFPKKPAAGWDQWKFLAAWRWSGWQNHYLNSGGENWQIEDRWKDMQELGYPHDFRTFNTMLTRLKLRVTKSKRSL